MSEGPLHDAIQQLGTQTEVAALLGRRQSTVSGYLKSKKPPIEVCLKIEVATQGKFRAEQLRPDLHREIAALRTLAKPKKRGRAA